MTRARSVWIPAGAVRRYSPRALVTAARAVPTNTTTAFGSGVPAASVTVPLAVPVCCWAHRTLAQSEMVTRHTAGLMATPFLDAALPAAHLLGRPAPAAVGAARVQLPEDPEGHERRDASDGDGERHGPGALQAPHLDAEQILRRDRDPLIQGLRSQPTRADAGPHGEKEAA